jgi:capsular exopolysaccharide synthesis family protein
MDRDDAVKELQYRLGTSPREGTDIVDVGLTLDDPVLAQRVTNAVVERFRSFSAGQEQEEAGRRRVFLEGQLAAADSALRVAQLALTDFRTREQVFSSRDRYLGQQGELMGVRSQIAQLEGEQRTYQSLLASLRPGANNSGEIQTVLAVPGVLSSPVIGGLFSQLSGFQTQRDTMTVGRWARAATDPDVQRIDSLISVTQQRLRSALQSQLRAMDVTLAGLRQQEVRAAGALQGAPQTEAEEVRLVAEAASMGEVVAGLREKYQQAKVEEAVQVGKVAVVDPALPGERQATTRIATMMMGLIFGLALGGGLALVLESSNTALRRRDGLEDLLQVPELAVVPRGAHGSRYASLPIPVSNGNGRANSGITDRALGTLLEPQSPFADAFRGLYQGVAFSQSVQHLRTLMVTSTTPGEGKSTIAANLAVAAAQAGKRVLLVDADFRRATQHRVFGVPQNPGLTHHLLALNTLDEVIRETRVPGLFVLPAGILPPNPPELLGGDALRDVLHRLGQQFDLVVVDTAPLASTGDALALARSTDGVILAVRVGHTDREAARGSVRTLSIAGARVLGAVVSDPGASWRNGRSAGTLAAVEV